MKTVLITGTSSGFGELTARTLLQKGYRVAATMRDLETRNAEAAQRLGIVAKETPGNLLLFDLDVTSEPSVNLAVNQVLEAAGSIDVVVNNAGYALTGFMESVTEEQLIRQFDVNLFGVQRVMRAVLPSMRRREKGLIINVSSIMGRIILPFAGIYTASKYALEGLSESYRYELAATGVDIAMVEPGAFGTQILAKMAQGQDQVRLKSYGSVTEMSDKMWSGLGETLKSGDAPNPQLVADAIVNLIETPAGKRPLRTVVDPLMGGDGPTLINQTTDNLQAQILENLGMKTLLSVNG